MKQIQDLSKHVDFSNLNDRYDGNTAPKTLIFFKGPLGFYRNVKETYMTLEKAEEEQEEFKSKVNEIVIGSKKKSKDQKSVIKNIKTLYESREKVMELFNNYSRIAS